MSSPATESGATGSSESTSNTLQANWRWLAVAGVLIALFGLVATLAPFFTGLSISLLLGILLVVSGVLHFVGVFSASGWTGAIWQIFLGVVTLGAGLLIFFNPLAGLLTLTLLVIAYLLVSGVVEIVMGLRLRDEPNWFVGVVSGSIGVLLAVMLWVGFPSTALWAVGVLFGVNLLVTGATMAIFAYSARNAAATEGMEQPVDVGGA